MRLTTDVDFSIIIPSRNRVPMLTQCLRSFFSLADNPGKMEAIVIADFDDETMIGFRSPYNMKLIHVEQSSKHIRDYNNYGAQCSTGKYVMVVNDDMQMATPKWDRIIKSQADQFLDDKPDRLLYIHVDDSTHTYSGRVDELGCCCPIVTKETVDTINGIMPGEIDMWGADVALYFIFKSLPEDRILNLIDEIKVYHHSRHNHTAEPDDTSRHVESISKKAMLSNAEMDHYINALASRLTYC